MAIIGGYLALILSDIMHKQHYVCLCIFKRLTGIPCPGCGMGRATLELLRGNVAGSLHYNILCPPFTVAVATSLVWLCIDMTKEKKTFFPFVKKDISVPTKSFLFLLIAIDWVFNIYRHI